MSFSFNSIKTGVQIHQDLPANLYEDLARTCMKTSREPAFNLPRMGERNLFLDWFGFESNLKIKIIKYLINFFIGLLSISIQSKALRAFR